MQKIDEYRRKGGTVIVTGRLPSLAPGLKEEADAAKIRETGEHLNGHRRDEAGRSHARGAGGRRGHGARDRIRSSAPTVRRSLLRGQHQQPPGAQRGRLPREGSQAGWWDPFTGKISAAASTNLDLGPYESRVLVFSRERLESAAPRTAVAGSVDLSGDWKVTFPNQTVEMKTLRSWTDDEATKYFSGLATYERAAAVPKGMLTGPVFLTFGEGTPVTTEEKRAGNGMRAMLESPVHEAAVVYVNGKRAGSVWHPPYEVEVTNLLHAGDNSIRIVVANLALNEMAKGPLPDYRELNAKYGERFQAQDMNQVKPIESGLLGPIRLVTR